MFRCTEGFKMASRTSLWMIFAPSSSSRPLVLCEYWPGCEEENRTTGCRLVWITHRRVQRSFLSCKSQGVPGIVARLIFSWRVLLSLRCHELAGSWWGMPRWRQSGTEPQDWHRELFRSYRACVMLAVPAASAGSWSGPTGPTYPWAPPSDFGEGGDQSRTASSPLGTHEKARIGSQEEGGSGGSHTGIQV